MKMMMGWLYWMVVVVVVIIGSDGVWGVENVTYDGRSLVIDGERRLLFSGSIHYPRSTPQMWPSLINKAKEGGIEVIQTYVFWNLHEPQQGQYNFEGRYDLVKFIKEIQAQGLYATLRIGPFIEAEWTYGGFPFWLHDIPGIIYRTDNEPFKYYMQNFTTKIVNMMKSEGLYASQGGPIILSQIENEYQNVEAAFGEKGQSYVRWAAKMAVGLQTGVPWVMCKQTDAPDPVINTCNGQKCGETFVGPNSPNKPALWTENWTSFLEPFGEEPYLRSAEDIAYHVALFIAKKNGSYINYYMYHGGTNFGRTGASYMRTSYYDQAPLDEYGLIRQPKWGHLKELHAAIRLMSQTLLWGTVSNFSLGPLQEADVFQGKSGDCAAFLINKDQRHSATVKFQDESYEVPAKSISILLDCKNVIFNTAKVSTQQNSRLAVVNKKFDSNEKWETFQDVLPTFAGASVKSNSLLEHMGTTKDKSDYLWYILSFEYSDSTDAQPILNITSLGHVMHAFVNNEYIGNSHGSRASQGCYLDEPIKLNNGRNNISILSVMVGLPDSGAHLEKRFAGLRSVRLESKGKGTRDFGRSLWGYQVGLFGEKLQIYTEEGSDKVKWSSIGNSSPLTWYKTTFDAPKGDDPVVLNLGSMGKGEAWVNGQSIGRYWPSFYTPKGNPSQTLYHVPRSFLKESGNLLVLLEEFNGNPLNVSVDTIVTDKVCGLVSESHLPPINSWTVLKRSGGRHKHLHGRKPRIQLECPSGTIISKILFASYGTPFGDCQNYAVGRCHSSNSKNVVEMACIGKRNCSISKSTTIFGEDPCPGISKSLLVDAQCR